MSTGLRQTSPVQQPGETPSAGPRSAWFPDRADSPGPRLVVVGRQAGGNAFGALERSYPEWQFAYCESFLSGICEVARRPAQAVLARLESAPRDIEDAVAGLREAAGGATKLLLSCAPAQEPLARAALAAGADDYVLEPLQTADLDQSLGYRRAAATVAEFAAAPNAAGELERLSAVLAAAELPAKEFLQKLAEVLREAVGARGAGVVMDGAFAGSGEVVRSPVLSAALREGGRVCGQLLIGEREGGYTLADAQRLEKYAELFGRLLAMAGRHRETEALALTDECSGLPNRRYLRERLSRILERAAVERFQVTVLLFDVDNFKSYNDRFGHDAGDEIIRSTGQLFRRNSREQDIVARYGGDEFCVIFWDPAGPREAGSKHLEEALVVLDRFKGALRAHQFNFVPQQATSAGTGQASASGQPNGPGEGGADYSITISGGLATFPWDGATVDALLTRADQALLAAKRAGKNRIFTVS